MGTQSSFYRPKISAALKTELAASASKIGIPIGEYLHQAVDEKIGRKRGRTARSEEKRAVDVLLGSAVLDLARYEDAIANLAEHISGMNAAGLVNAEALDYVAALQAAILIANADLRRDMFGALERLPKGKERKRDERC